VHMLGEVCLFVCLNYVYTNKQPGDLC
jgi:hypothetical protein